MAISEIPFLYSELEKIVGKPNLLSDSESLKNYGHDETEDLVFPPQVVVKPGSSLEISQILKMANACRIPVTVRGGGTGLSGSALPIHGGILISMERFNKILSIDTENHQAICEPGVVTEAFQNMLAEIGLFYPVDPSSKGSCTLGGNLAQSAGGPRAVKYGTTRENVLNLEVVLPNGEIIWTGANVLKYSTGYNLTQLMIGSEGTLGIVTKAVFKIRPLPSHTLLMLVPFRNIEEACEAVSEIFMAGILPSCLEFMERTAIDFTLQYLKSDMKIEPDIEAHLLIELDGFDVALLQDEAEKVFHALDRFDIGEVLLADSEQQKDELWLLRRKAAYAVRHTSVYKEEDTVVPRRQLPKLIRFIKELEIKYGFTSICYGHAGDGNLHINILKTGLSDLEWDTLIPQAIKELFEFVVKLEGTISGEHGIGLVQKPYLSIAISEAQLNLMRGIKRTFDPNNILNPGKIFDL
jgi:glycolate oxidase